MFAIYKITNKTNKMSYVGKTKNLDRRIKEHQKRKDCRFLNRAILKYGIDNFKVEIVECGLSFEEASLKEGVYIKKYKTLAPNGYNLILETQHGRIPSDETVKKMGEARQRRPIPRKNKFIGVRERSKNRFEARLKFRDKTYSKYFEDEKTAAESYDKLAIHFYGKNSRVNFPQRINSYKQKDLLKNLAFFKKKKKQSSQYKGVGFHRQSKKWRAYAYEGRKQIALGLYETEEGAFFAAKKYEKLTK